MSSTHYIFGVHTTCLHGSDENALSWDFGYIPYKQLENVLSETVAGYPHLYNYGVSNCRFLKELTGPPL